MKIWAEQGEIFPDVTPPLSGYSSTASERKSKYRISRTIIFALFLSIGTPALGAEPPKCGSPADVGTYITHLRSRLEPLLAKKADQATIELAAFLTNVSNALPVLVTVHKRLAVVAGISPPIMVCFLTEINAWVTTSNRPIFVNVGLLNLTGPDEDMLAAVVGHELAHLVRNHSAARQHARAVFNAEASTVARSIFQQTRSFGQANEIRGKYFTARDGAFSREQEADADDYGTVLLSSAKFKPDGSLRFFAKLMSAQGNRPTRWTDQHPSHGDRYVKLEPRVVDENFDQAVKSLIAEKDWGALARAIDAWIKELPESGRGWFHKAAYLERIRRIEYVAAYERAILNGRPAIFMTEEERGQMWFSLCVGLYREGHIRESAVCARNIRYNDLRSEFDAQTFKGKLITAGEIPKYDSLSVARDSDGRKYITNDPSFLKARGVSTHKAPPPWGAVRSSPQSVERPLTGR